MNYNCYEQWEAERDKEARAYAEEYLEQVREYGDSKISYTTNYTKHTVEYVLAKVYFMLKGHNICLWFKLHKKRNRTYVCIELYDESTIEEDTEIPDIE